MQQKKYVEETLTMPSNMPLFNYNINFQGLKHLVQQLNMQANSNSEEISYIKQQLLQKLATQKLNQQQQILNNSLKFGFNTQKVIESLQTMVERQERKDELNMNNMELFAFKIGKFTKAFQYLLDLAQRDHQKIQVDNRTHQKNIDESFRRIDEKVESSLQSMMKNINLYFTETNKKISSLQTDLNCHKRESTASLQSLNINLNQRVSDIQLKAAINGLNQQVKSSILADLNDDNMKRLATLNQYSNKLKQHIKQSQLKIKNAKNNVKQLNQKVAKSLPIQTFQVEKHKIFERLSQYKNKIDELTRKNQQFVQFRKGVYESNERVKHNLLQLEDEIKKLGEKGANFKKMEDIGSVLSSLDPHLICQLGSEVKLHQKQIGKLQKQIIYLQNEVESARTDNTKMPEVNGGQNADMITKIIKQYMTNLDFQGRVKRLQTELYNVSKKNDGVNQLQKKIYMLSKQLDVGAIMKQIKRKADDENTRKDFKIVDSKVQKLFDFYKQVRRDIEQIYKRSSTGFTKQSSQNASLVTKKLHSPYCLSCTPRHRSYTAKGQSRAFSKNKIQMNSIDQSFDGLKKSMYVKGATATH